MLLILLPSWPRWSETFLRQDLALLREAGLDFQTAALFPGDCEPAPDWPTVEVLSPKTPRIKRRNSASFRLPPCLAQLLSRWKQRALRRHLCELVSAHGITHIHAEFADIAALLACETAHRMHISFSVGIHAADVHRPKYPLLSLFQDASFVLSCNQAASNALLEQMPSLQGKISLMPHGVDLRFWQYRPALPYTKNLLFVGRLVPKKGLPLLLNALAELPDDVTLTVVGDGPMSIEWKALADSLGIAERISWTGVLPREQVREQMAHSYALVMPSVVDASGDRDGIPNVVTEAMAMGLPVIGTQNGGLPEILSDETGWPVPQETPSCLADTIRRCLSQPSQAEQRRLRARTIIEQHFDAQTLANQRRSIFGNFAQ